MDIEMSNQNPDKIPPNLKKCRDIFCGVILVGILVCINVAFILIMTIVLMVAIPLLLFFLYVVRFLELLKEGDGYYRATEVKSVVRLLLFLSMCMLLIPLGISYLVASQVPKINNMTLLFDMPMTHLLTIATISCGFYLLNYFLFVIAQSLSPPLSWQHETHINATQALYEIIDCLVFWWATEEVMKRLPHGLHQFQILGLNADKWVEVPIFVLLGIDTIAIFCHVITYLIQKGYQRLHPANDKNFKSNFWVEKILRRKLVVYWAKGLRSSFIFILSSFLLLLTWVFYFGCHLNGTPDRRKVLRFGTLSGATLLTFAFLWLIKCCILLTWQANQVYSTLDTRVVDTRKHLYFLGILGDEKYDIFNLRGGESTDSSFWKTIGNNRKLPCLQKLFPKMRERVDHDFFIEEKKKNTETLHDLQQLCQYFLAAQPTLSNDTYATDVLQYLISPTKQRTPPLEQDLWKLIKGKIINNSETPDSSKSHQEQTEKVWFMVLLNKGDSTWDEISKEQLRTFRDETSEEQLRTWLERAHGTCLDLANTLSSAKEVVDCLNNIISGVLIGATFILWLLLTGLATTKILVIVVSPLLAATFIFGDYCKRLFEGIIFAYVIHPFHVGDLCVIDDNMVEVKRVGVWKTIFVNIETDEEVLYPNSELANKKVINHKSEFDWNDRLEFHVKSCHSKLINAMEVTIKDDLDKDKNCTLKYFNIEVPTAEADIKMVVHLKYKNNQQGRTFFECLQQKHKLRFEFSLKISELVKQTYGA